MRLRGPQIGPAAVTKRKVLIPYRGSIIRKRKKECSETMRILKIQRKLKKKRNETENNWKTKTVVERRYCLLLASFNSELTSETMNRFRYFSRTPWTGDQSVIKPLLTQDSTTQRNAAIQPCDEWDSDPRLQR
jgi:hypothetical protein